MKKSFKLVAAIAVAAITMVACNNNNATEEVVDSAAAIEQVAEEQQIEEPVAVEIADTLKQEAAQAVQKAAKKTVKAAEQKVVVKEAGINTNTEQNTTIDKNSEVKQVTGKVTKVERKRR